jgi:hypothetical protein
MKGKYKDAHIALIFGIVLYIIYFSTGEGTAWGLAAPLFIIYAIYKYIRIAAKSRKDKR